MRKKIFTFLGIILTAVVLVACGKTTYEVSFDVAGGTPEISTVKVDFRQLVSEPTAPTRDGYELVGWFLDGEEWVFASDKVTKNITLVAQWEEDVTDGVDGREVEFNVSDTHIEWRYVGEETWNELIDLDLLKGAAGEAGSNGTDGREVVIEIVDNEIVWKYEGDKDYHSLIDLEDLKGKDGNDGSDGKDGFDGISVVDVTINEDGHLILTLSDDTEIDAGKVVGKDGVDGREVEFNVSDTHIEWRYVGEETWNELIDLDLLKGAAGEAGSNGTDGREVVIEIVDNEIVWKYEGDKDYHSLINLEDLKGKDGNDGSDGKDGLDGISVVDVTINEDGHLILTLSDDTEIDAGKVVGKDGQDGTDGLSAYQIYLKYNVNYNKTEAEWLTDLVRGKLSDSDTLDVLTYEQLLLAISSGETKIQLQNNIFALETVKFTSLVNINFNGYTLNGNLDVVTEEFGIMNITGKGTLTGNFRIDAINATLNSDLNVDGKTIIDNIAPSTFNTTGIHKLGIEVKSSGRINIQGLASETTVTINTLVGKNVTVEGSVKKIIVTGQGDVTLISAIVKFIEVETKTNFNISQGSIIEKIEGLGAGIDSLIVISEDSVIPILGESNNIGNIVVLEEEIAAAKAAFLDYLNGAVATIDAAEVTIDEEDITASFKWNATVDEVYQAANGLIEALKGQLDAATLTVTREGAESQEFNLNNSAVAIELARYLLGDMSPEDFLADKESVTASYTAVATNKAGVSFNLEGSLEFKVGDPSAEDIAQAKRAFLTYLDGAVVDIDAADVTIVAENITASFKWNATVDEVYQAANGLIEALKGQLDAATLTVTREGAESQEFNLNNSAVAIELARYLLGDMSPEDFLADKESVTASYTAVATNKAGVSFNLEGSLEFKVGDPSAEDIAQAKRAFLTYLDGAVVDIDAADVTIVAENITASFKWNATVDEVYQAANGLIEALKGQLDAATLTVTREGAESQEFNLNNSAVAIELARYLLGDMSPEDFLADKESVTASYTAVATNKAGVSFNLEGSLEFKVGDPSAEDIAQAKRAFLTYLDGAVVDIDAADVTIVAENITASFKWNATVDEVYQAANGLIEALKGQLDAATLTVTREGAESQEFNLNNSAVAIELARYLLGDMSPEDFLADKESVTASYTAVATNKAGVSFNLEGSLEFKVGDPSAEDIAQAKRAFLTYLDGAVVDIDAADVTIVAENITASFKWNATVDEVYQAANGLIEALKGQLDAATLTVTREGAESQEFNLNNSAVAIELARYLLGDMSPEDFLADKESVTASYTAVATNKAGVSFNLEGSLEFKVGDPSAEDIAQAKRAFLTYLDGAVVDIDAADVTIVAENITASFKWNATVDEVYQAANGLIEALKGQLDAATLTVTREGAESQEFNLNNSAVAIELARYLLGDMSPEDFLADKESVTASYTAVATNKAGVSFNLEGSLEFKVGDPSAEDIAQAKRAFLTYLDGAVVDIDAADVTIVAENITASFKWNATVDEVYQAANGLIEALKGQLDAATLTVTREGAESQEFNLNNSAVAIELARYLLGDMSPEDFLADKESVTASYTAVATNKAGVSFNLEGSLEFKVGDPSAEDIAQAKRAFLTYLDGAVVDIDAADVTIVAENITASFKWNATVDEVYQAANGLIEALKGQLDAATLTVTREGAESQEFNLNNSAVAIELARYLLGDMSPEDFLADKESVTASYTAVATNKAGVSFNLEGSLEFKVGDPSAEDIAQAKRAFLTYLDGAVVDIDAADVTIVAENITASFKWNATVDEVYQAANGLIEALKGQLDAATLTVTREGAESQEFNLNNSAVAIELARYLLGDMSPEDFLADKESVTASYTAVATNKAGVSFNLEGSLEFKVGEPTADEVAQAITAAIEEASDGDTITLIANVSFPGGLTINKIVNLEFAGFTITGDVTINSDSEGTLIIREGTIDGNLTVNTPNASVENNATVTGEINIEDVKEGTWTEYSDGNTLTVKDTNGMVLKIVGKVEAVTISQSADGNITVTFDEKAEIESMEINAPVTLVSPKPVSAVIAERVKVTVKEDEDSEGVDVVGSGSDEKEEIDYISLIKAAAIEAAETAIANLPSVEKVAIEDAGAVAEAKALVAAVKVLDPEAEVEGEKVIAELEAKIAELEEAQAKEAFLTYLDGAVANIDEADVTIDEEDISANFKWYKTVDEVYQAASGLIDAIKDELEAATLTLIRGENSKAFNLYDGSVAIEVGQYLLGEMSPEEFLAEKPTVTANYSVAATNKEGVSFNLVGSLEFTVSEKTEAEIQEINTVIGEKIKPAFVEFAEVINGQAPKSKPPYKLWVVHNLDDYEATFIFSEEAQGMAPYAGLGATGLKSAFYKLAAVPEILGASAGGKKVSFKDENGNVKTGGGFEWELMIFGAHLIGSIPDTVGEIIGTEQIMNLDCLTENGIRFQMEITFLFVAAEDQDAPEGLAGVAPTSVDNKDGKITATTTDMEYRLQVATEEVATVWIKVTGTEITGLAAGTYEVRYAAKAGYSASPITEVVVDSALVAAKTAAKAALDEYVNAENYTENAATLAAAIAAGNTAIDEAETTDAVATALANAKLVIDAIESDTDIAEREAAEALAAAKTSAKAELGNYADAAEYTENAEALEAAIAAGNTAIDEATTTDEIDSALADAKVAIDAIESDTDIAEREAAEALAAAKTSAKDELDSYKDAEDYKINADDLAAAIAAGETAIDEATTAGEVDLALAEAKVAINEIKTDADIAAADLQTAKGTIEGLTYIDLVVDDMEDATKKAAVEAVVNAASLPEGVTATVNADGSQVKLSKDLADDVVVDTNATFKLNVDAQAAADAAEFKSDHAAILAKTVETVAIENKASVEAALEAYDELSSEAQAKLVDGEKTLLNNLLVKISGLEAAADLQTAKETIEGLDYTNLEVDELDNDAKQKAAVEVIVGAASLPEGVTATVNDDGSKVTLSKDLADDVVVDTNATFKLSVEIDPDQGAANEVIGLINGLPAVEELTLDDKDAVVAAKAAYGELTPEQKGLILEETLAKLNAVFKQVFLVELDAKVAEEILSEVALYTRDGDSLTVEFVTTNANLLLPAAQGLAIALMNVAYGSTLYIGGEPFVLNENLKQGDLINALFDYVENGEVKAPYLADIIYNTISGITLDGELTFKLPSDN